MKYFTKEQIEEIKTLDQGRMEYHFSCVLDSGFKRGSSGNADARLYDIYEQVTGKHLPHNGCKTCQYNNYKEIATLYKKSKEYWEKKEEEEAENEIVEMVTTMAGVKSPKATTKTKTIRNKTITKKNVKK